MVILVTFVLSETQPSCRPPCCSCSSSRSRLTRSGAISRRFRAGTAAWASALLPAPPQRRCSGDGRPRCRCGASASLGGRPGSARNWTRRSSLRRVLSRLALRPRFVEARGPRGALLCERQPQAGLGVSRAKLQILRGARRRARRASGLFD